jgi:hypothetical protein
MPRSIIPASTIYLSCLCASYLFGTAQSPPVFVPCRSIVHHAEHTLATDRYNFDSGTAYQAVAYSVRDYLVESFRDTKAHYMKEDPKRVYYLSLEFLMGRSLLNSLMNLDLEKPYKEALEEIGYKLEDMVEEEKDAALGNGGLGRLAACFLDSMATLSLPAWGYGIRYEHGMFEQRFKDGNQVLHPARQCLSPDFLTHFPSLMRYLYSSYVEYIENYVLYDEDVMVASRQSCYASCL